MKKLLSLLGAIGLVATTGATVVACGRQDTKKDVANDVVTSQNYQIASQNVAASEVLAEGTDLDEILINKFENQLRGYLNPLFLNLIGQNQANVNEDYEIHGITAQSINDALEQIKSGSEEVQLSGITVVAKDNAQFLKGEIVLPTVSLLTGSDLLELVKEAEKLVFDCEDYFPTFAELIKKLNESIAESTGELEKLKLGHFTFQIEGRKIIVRGNGLYYGTFVASLNSLKAIDISTIITPDKSDLGEMGFISVPTSDQLYSALSDRFGGDYVAENLEIISRDHERTKLSGHRFLKGEVEVTYKQGIFDLANITNKNLGALENPPANKTELIQKVNAINDGLGLQEDLVTIGGRIGDTSVHLAAKENSPLVQGAVEIKWSIKQFDLNEVIKVTDLGALAINATDSVILERINQLNNTSLKLGQEVKIEGIQDTENGGRTAVLSALDNHPKYRGSIRVNWTKIAELTNKNIELAIKNLSEQNRLEFKIKAGTSLEAAQKTVTDKIKEMLGEKYAVPSGFKIEYSEFPDEEFLGKVSSPNNPWLATNGATMTFTLNDKENPVAVKVIWRIDVVE